MASKAMEHINISWAVADLLLSTPSAETIPYIQSPKQHYLLLLNKLKQERKASIYERTEESDGKKNTGKRRIECIIRRTGKKKQQQKSIIRFVKKKNAGPTENNMNKSTVMVTQRRSCRKYSTLNSKKLKFSFKIILKNIVTLVNYSILVSL